MSSSIIFTDEGSRTSRGSSFPSKFRLFVAELSKKHSAPSIHSIRSGIVQNKKKRTYYESFGNDIERYGHEIDDTYFATNIGHAVIG